MIPSRKYIHNHADAYQSCTEPERKPKRWARGNVLHELELLKEQSKPRDYEAKAHQTQASTNPCKESALRSQVVSE